MTLLANINKEISNNIESFVLQIIEHCNLSHSKDDIMKLWNGNKISTVPSFDMSTILKASKQELMAECRKRRLKVSGTKAELCSRLTGEKTSPTRKKKTSPTLKKKTSPTPKILVKIQTEQSKIQIRKNAFGNFEHAETKFVLDKTTQKVIGVQNADGTINPLTDTDIDICNKYKFSYEIEAVDKSRSDTVDSDFSEDLFSD
jgi:hypothetical protein